MFQLLLVPKMNLYDHPTSNRNNSLLYSSLVLSKSLKWGGLLLYINEINITLFIQSYLFQNVWMKFHHRLLWSIVIKRTLFKMKLLVAKYLRCSLWNGLYIVFLHIIWRRYIFGIISFAREIYNNFCQQHSHFLWSKWIFVISFIRSNYNRYFGQSSKISL